MAEQIQAVLLLNVILAAVSAPVDDVKVTAVDLGSDIEIINAVPPGVILIGDVEVDIHRNAVLNNHRWDHGQIPYVIDSTYSSDMHNNILTAMREIEHDVNEPTGTTCIKFIPRTTQTNYVSVYPGTGCHSIVGMANKGKQDVSLGKGCESKGIIMHELIHSIGFWHEQSRSDRNNYVNINLANVGADEQHDFQLLSTSSSNNLNTPYDFGSIMHYNPYEFAEDKSIPVITPKAGLGLGVKMGQRLSLSKSDVTKIQRLYGCTEDTTHITTPLLASNIMAACSFEASICTLQNDAAGDFQWVRKSGVNVGGPKAGNTNGADSYLLATSAGHHGVARVTTPSFNKGSVCVDFYLYQAGPSSYLDLVVFGPHLPRQSFQTYHNAVYNSWHHTRVYLTVAQGVAFQVSFEAHINSGNIAIDDVQIYHGQCL